MCRWYVDGEKVRLELVSVRATARVLARHASSQQRAEKNSTKPKIPIQPICGSTC